MKGALKAVAPKSVLELILEWSAQRPAWQQDALRRIVLKGALGDADIAELVSLCKKGKGEVGIAHSPIPLARMHLPSNPAASGSIRLSSIADVVSVNQLAPFQQLAFEPGGLTIIYGDNGAGKSGYARILKRACRARHPGEIVPDAFDPLAAITTPRALLAYSIGGVDQPPLTWTDNCNPHPVLSAISVFDRDSAAVHIREKNEVAFRPFGLDIPDELAAATQRVKDALAAEQGALEKAQDAVFVKPPWKPTTAVGRILSSLKMDTKLGPLLALAAVSDQERERHQRLTEDLSKDPLKASAEQVVYADDLRQLAAALDQTHDENRDERLQALKSSASDARIKRAAAKLAADNAFGSASIPGVGGEAWRLLWNAARGYSEEVAYAGQPFPRTEDGSVCVLCHQPLTAKAGRRLQTFEAFVRADTERLAQEAEAAFSKALKWFQDKPVRAASHAAIRRRITIAHPGLARSVLRLLASARLRRRLCLLSLDKDNPLALPAFAPNPATDVRTLEASTRAYAKELKDAADVDGRTRLEAARDELSDRLLLADMVPKAEAEVARLKALKLVAACLPDTTTNLITKLGNDIADSLITPKIRDQFQSEIVSLAANKVRVEIVRSGGKYGSPQYQVRFFGNANVRVHAILSEGEQTCVALAVFLTELATAAHQSALVFDDPVSSLDHRWRKKVAQRLAQEAVNRQIIVFTHDLVFVNDLKDLAEAASVPVKLMSVSRGPAGTGVVSPGLPWRGTGVKDRADKLEKEVRQAKQHYDNNDEEAYRNRAFQIYNGLRSTWERAIEDIAFNGVVVRHRDYVDTKKLRKATVLTDADCDAFEAGFKKCCDQTDAHDPSRARNEQPPPPDEILKDVQAVLAWVNSIRDRQKAIP
jgi:energy-coupling factor transporter ATP-binding protein EcfA2